MEVVEKKYRLLVLYKNNKILELESNKDFRKAKRYERKGKSYISHNNLIIDTSNTVYVQMHEKKELN